jgi:hypothetical protein
MSDHGKNVTRLILQFVPREAIPPGGGLADALLFFQDAEHRKQVLDNAEALAMRAIELIKSAPDNPYGDDDETIAAEILRQIQERKK